MYINKKLFVLLFCVVAFILGYSTWEYVTAPAKVQYDCNNLDAAENTVISHAKAVCPNGWSGKMEMTKDENSPFYWYLGMDCNGYDN